MGILNRLWGNVWEGEEAKKARKANLYASEMYKKIHETESEMKAELTDVQKEALKMGGPEHDTSGGSFQQINQNLLYQQALHNQNAAITNQMNILGGVYPGQGIGGGTSAITTGISGAVVTGMGSVTGVSNVALGYPAQRMHRWPTLGNNDRDNFFMALKGIEEASMKNPEGNSKYDEDAYSIQDLRTFDPQKINLLGVLSFCLANLIDSHGIITLLEGHGMQLVLE